MFTGGTVDSKAPVTVMRIDNGGLTGKKVKAPVRDEWLGGSADSAAFQPSAGFGFMCPLLKPGLSVP